MIVSRRVRHRNKGKHVWRYNQAEVLGLDFFFCTLARKLACLQYEYFYLMRWHLLFSWLILLKFEWKASPGNSFGALSIIGVFAKATLMLTIFWSSHKPIYVCIYKTFQISQYEGTITVITITTKCFSIP